MKKIHLAILLCLLTLQISAFTTRISLNGLWNLHFWKQPTGAAITTPQGMAQIKTKMIKGTVPGNVELDLLHDGLIKDPMVGSAVNELRSWEGYQWCYERTFATPETKEGQSVILHFGGIDCLADIWLNDKHIGSAENMMLEHDFDVTDAVLKDGRENRLQVILRSSVLEGQKYLLGPISIGNFPSAESIFLRKAPHTYGWDILPRLVSAGLWRNVELHIVDSVHIRNVHFFVTSIDTANHTAQVYADVQLTAPMEYFDRMKMDITLTGNGKETLSSATVTAPAIRHTINVSNAAFWWPRGLGKPELYQAVVTLKDENGKILDRHTERIGLRKIRLEHTDINLPNKPGKFCFYVNDTPIFIHGTNWVPLDALHSRDSLHLKQSIEMAVDLNCNMIRCWGGNVYEQDKFYDLCDENGILVWQDFTMGCTFYPQRASFLQKIEEEVQQIVCKLRNHPCIALWAGNNEDDAATHWSMAPINYDPNKDQVSRVTIPAVLYEFDPTRPYLPSSPYYSEAIYQHGWGDDLLPENHLWGPRGYYKADYYVKAKNQFVSEIGYHGCPNKESLQKMMTAECVYPWKKGTNQWNEEWLTKSVRRYAVEGKTNYRNDLMINQVKLLFGELPENLDDFIFASQAVQAEAMKFFVELWRGKKFNPAGGIIWWNLRDGWPVISDAIVDYYMSKKMAYYFIKNAQYDICAFVNDGTEGNSPTLKLANDTRTDAAAEIEITDNETGKQIYKNTAYVAANSLEEVAHLPQPEGQGMWILTYKVKGKTYTNHYLYGKPPFKLKHYRQLLKKVYQL